MPNSFNFLMFVYICKRSLVGVRDILSQFGCSVFGQEDHHGTHDNSQPVLIIFNRRLNAV